MKRIEVLDKLSKSSRHNKFKILSQYARDAMLRSMRRGYVTDGDWNLIISEMKNRGKIKQEILDAQN